MDARSAACRLFVGTINPRISFTHPTSASSERPRKRSYILQSYDWVSIALRIDDALSQAPHKPSRAGKQIYTTGNPTTRKHRDRPEALGHASHACIIQKCHNGNTFLIPYKIIYKPTVLDASILKCVHACIPRPTRPPCAPLPSPTLNNNTHHHCDTPN